VGFKLILLRQISANDVAVLVPDAPDEGDPSLSEGARDPDDKRGAQGTYPRKNEHCL